MTDDALVYDGWLKVFRRTVNGRTYDVLRPLSAVAAWVTNGQGDVLLVRQFRPAVLRETWEIPAGVLDKQELGPAGVLREELLEEAGLEVPEDRMEEMLSYVPQIGHNDSRLTLYRIRLEGTPQIPLLEDDDVLEARWVPLKLVEEWINRGIVYDEKTLLAYYHQQAQRDRNLPAGR